MAALIWLVERKVRFLEVGILGFSNKSLCQGYNVALEKLMVVISFSFLLLWH